MAAVLRNLCVYVTATIFFFSPRWQSAIDPYLVSVANGEQYHPVIYGS